VLHVVVLLALGTAVVAVSAATITVTATSAAATTPTTTSTAATAPSASEALLLIVITALLPVIVVAAVASTTALAAISALEELLGVALVGLELTLADQLALLFTVGLLGHNFKVVFLPLGDRVEGKELGGSLLVDKGDEDGSLEETLVCAAELETVNFAELGEEALEIELSIRLLVTESLDVYSGSLGLGFSRHHGLVGNLALQLLLALLTGQVEELAVLEGSDDGRVRLEGAHALEGVNSLQLHGLVLGAAAGLPHELILGEIPIAEVKLDLYSVSISFIA
jgi:hypothetical protein